MDVQCANDSLSADLNALREELTQLHAEARKAASGRRNESQSDQGSILHRSN
jgi:hypothetical protein